MTQTHLTAPLDERSAADLAEAGLRLALVDLADTAALDAWIVADFRGFHGRRPSEEVLEEARANFGGRRTTAVYDEGVSTPVGTVNSWVAPLTVPGGGSLDSWAISSVTVAPTHRRQGVATALLGAELRTAHALGVPAAILTVSESTIYGRWGFGPATFATGWSVDAKRVRWTGAPTPGRLTFTTPDEYRETGRAVLAEAMASRPGEIGLEPYLADRLLGPLKGDDDAARYLLVRYDSPDGRPEGFVSYVVRGGEEDFSRHVVEVNYLAAVTDAALTGLWRYLLELDLVAEVKAWTRGVDEPVQLLVQDIRGARITSVQDHLWVRILDVPATLTARRYESDGDLVLQVTDALGFADGRYRLIVEDGEARVESTADAPDVTLPVEALGSVYLGHDLARGLALAGRLDGDAEALDRLFRTAVPPRLSTWF